MFRALNENGQIVLATRVTSEDGSFYCPDCRGEVMYRHGTMVEPHFAHFSDVVCTLVSLGESEMHRKIKEKISNALARHPEVSDVQLVHPLGDAQPDISFCCRGTLVALEIRGNTLSPKEIEQRTLEYMRQNVAVLWVALGSLKLFEERYAPGAWK